MKKVVLTIAILASGLSTYAMSNTVAPSNVIVNQVNNEFTEVAVEDLPEAIKEAVKKDFSGATIEKAYINNNGHYKLELSVEGSTSTIYADKDGNWLEAEAIK